MRERKLPIVFSLLCIALAFLMAGCFMEAGTLPTPEPGAALAVTDIGATPQDVQSVTEAPTLEISPTIEGVIPSETPVDVPFIPTETPADLPLVPTETPFETGLLPTETPIDISLVATETPVDVPLVPTATDFLLIPATATPFPTIEVVVPTATVEVVNVVPTIDNSFITSTPPDMSGLFATATPFPTIEVVVPTATVEVVGVVPTIDSSFITSTPPDMSGLFATATPFPTIEVVVPTQEIVSTIDPLLPTVDFGQGGGNQDLAAIALATATAVTNLYNQSMGGASAPPVLPPVIVSLGFPDPPPAPLPPECALPTRVSLSQVIGPASLIVQFSVLEPNPDYNYTFLALPDGRLNVIGSTVGPVGTLSFNQPGTYEVRVQIKRAPGKETVNADGTRQSCQIDLIILQKITVMGR